MKLHEKLRSNVILILNPWCWLWETVIPVPKQETEDCDIWYSSSIYSHSIVVYIQDTGLGKWLEETEVYTVGERRACAVCWDPYIIRFRFIGTSADMNLLVTDNCTWLSDFVDWAARSSVHCYENDRIDCTAYGWRIIFNCGLSDSPWTHLFSMWFLSNFGHVLMNCGWMTRFRSLMFEHTGLFLGYACACLSGFGEVSTN